MANTIKLKTGSGSDPSASDLIVGEIAIRTDSGKLFTKKDNGTVAEISGSGGGIEDGDKGDITVSNGGDTFTIDSGVVTSAKIADGAIVNADINASAAIAGSKISPNFGSQAITGTTGTFTGGTLTLGTADSSSAHINSFELMTFNIDTDNDDTNRYFAFYKNGASGSGTELFKIEESGSVTVNGSIDITGANTVLKFTENDANPDFGFLGNSGSLRVQDITNSANLFIFEQNRVRSIKNFDAEAGLDVTGNISCSGTIDGVDIAARDTLFGGLTSSSGVLTNGVTATTQGSSDNTTKVATTAYVTTAISNLINNAPSALDTLKELSDALGADANFSTTVTNSLATKLPLAGGTLTGNLTISNTEPKIFLTDTNNNDDFSIQNQNGYFAVKDESDGQNRLVIHPDGTAVIGGNLDVGAGIDVTGNVIASGNITANNGTVTVSGSAPKITFTETNDNPDYKLEANGGNLAIIDTTNSATRFSVSLSGVSVTGNITVSGTVDGRDIATDGAKLDTIESNATADQTASEILTLIKTVDGAGSGLDADTLDGVSSASFLRSDANDTSSGTIAFGTGNLDPDSFSSHSGGFGNIADGSGWTARGLFVHGGGTGDAAAIAHNGSKLYFGIQNNSSANSMATWLDVTPSSRIINFQTADNANNVRIGGNKIFHAGNDGSGSGLNADLLDGVEGSNYLRSDQADTMSGNFSLEGNLLLTGSATTTNQDRTISFTGFDKEGTTDFTDNAFIRHTTNTGGHSGSVLNIASKNDSNDGIAFETHASSQLKHNGYTIWDANNDGSGSGLDSDLLDGQEGSYYRNASNLNAGTIPAARLSASDLLTKIKTVDGSGSGLDADTLDGISSASFLRSDAADTASANITINGAEVGAWSGGTAYKGLFHTNHDPSEYMIINNDGHTFISATAGSNVYIRAGGNSSSNQFIVTTSGATIGGNSVLTSASSLNASNLGSGTIPAARVPTLNQNTTGTSGGFTAGNASNLNSGTIPAARLPNHSASLLTSGTIPDGRISDIGNSQAAIITFDNLEKSNFSSDGQLGFDSSQGLLLYRTQQGTTGTVTVLDGANVDAGTGISITNTGTGGTATESFTFSLANHSADLLTSGTVADARISTLTASKLTGALPAIDGSNLTGIAAGATGGGSDQVFYENDQTVTTSYTITNGKNAMAAGPITIQSGAVLTVGSGENLTIV